MTKWFLALIALVAAGSYAVTHSASVLVANDPVKSDVIVVLAGARDDSRFWRGMDLMNRGYAWRLILDVQVPVSQFGVSDSELAQAFVAKNAPGRAIVCEASADSTFGEAVDVGRCLQPFHPSSVLIVTSDYHTRRALTIFKKRLPQYEWHVAALDAPLEPGEAWERYSDQWWKNRRWAKSVLDEWQKWTWWFLVDRWRARPVTSG